jgi:hypothetical protein
MDELIEQSIGLQYFLLLLRTNDRAGQIDKDECMLTY